MSDSLETPGTPPRAPSARVRTALAPLFGEPRISSAPTSQLVAGQLVLSLEQRDAWHHVLGEDGYDGWMHEGYLEPALGDETSWPMTTGAKVHEADGRVRELPFGARISPDASVLRGDVFDAATRTERFPAARTAICQSAEASFAGAPYVWGAVTPWGCDCSGFVQSIYRWHGVPLPRDAWQQALAGEAVATGAVQPADLLFFSDRDDGRITHVAIVLPDHRLVHSALARGGVHVESLHADDPYVQRLHQQCVTARRVV